MRGYNRQFEYNVLPSLFDRPTAVTSCRTTPSSRRGPRVPLIVRWPGLTRPGSTSGMPASAMDFLPTFLAAAGGAPPADVPSYGIDLRPALAGGAMPERTLFRRFHSKAQRAGRPHRLNATMLPATSDTSSFGWTPQLLADHYGWDDQAPHIGTSALALPLAGLDRRGPLQY